MPLVHSFEPAPRSRVPDSTATIVGPSIAPVGQRAKWHAAPDAELYPLPREWLTLLFDGPLC